MNLNRYIKHARYQAEELGYGIQERISRLKGNLRLPYRPLNIDADAAAIVNSGARAVKHILDQRAQLDSLGLYDAPLIVISGERHTAIDNYVHHMFVVSQVMKEETVAVAFEEPHNNLFQKLDQIGCSDIVEKMKACDLEENGALSLKAHAGITAFMQAPLAHFAFSHMLLRHKVSTCFCDAACDPNQPDNIDKTDPSSLESLRFFFGNELPEKVNIRDAAGLAVRSHHMAQTTMNFAARQPHRIVFLQCGDSHVIGRESDDFEGHNNLKFEGKNFGISSCFEKAAVPYIGIVLNGIEGLRKNPDWKSEKILICEGLPQVAADYNPSTGLPRKNILAHDIRNEVAESLYLNDLLLRTGLTTEIATLQERKKLRDQYAYKIGLYIRRARQETAPKLG